MSTHIDRISCLYLPIEFLKYKSNWATDRTRPNQVVNRAYHMWKHIDGMFTKSDKADSLISKAQQSDHKQRSRDSGKLTYDCHDNAMPNRIETSEVHTYIYKYLHLHLQFDSSRNVIDGGCQGSWPAAMHFEELERLMPNAANFEYIAVLSRSFKQFIAQFAI